MPIFLVQINFHIKFANRSMVNISTSAVVHTISGLVEAVKILLHVTAVD